MKAETKYIDDVSNFDGLYMHRYSCKGLIFREYDLLLIKKWNKPWDFPGGKKEQNESLEKCIVRETREETNAKVRILNMYPPTQSFDKVRSIINHQHTYLLEYIDGKVRNKEPKKHEAVAWFDMRALPKNLSGRAQQLITEFYNEKLKILETTS